MENEDLRALLFQLYLKNNPRLQHQAFIYSFNGIQHPTETPFQYTSMDLHPSMKKNIILQNLASGEMMQAFIVPIVEKGKTMFQIENDILYGNKTGVLVEIGLDAEKIANTAKYRQFTHLAKAFLQQFM